MNGTRWAVLLCAALLTMAAGCRGDRGDVGPAGAPCTVTEENGTKMVSCPDGTSVALTPGKDGTGGTDGTSCSLVDKGDGTKTITCGTTEIEVSDGKSCALATAGGVRTVTCPDGSVITVSDGLPGVGLGSPAIKTLVVNNLVFGVDAAGLVTASFEVTDGAKRVTGLTTAATTIYLAGLIPGTNGDSDEWQYWTGVSDTTLVEGPAGIYLLTTNKRAADAPAGSNPQRGIVQVVKVGYNAVVKGYDFAMTAPGTPVAAGKDVVNDASCKECHGYGVTIHGYGRNDTKTCVVCHSPKYNDTIASHEADMVTMVHQIHTNKAATLGALHMSDHGENWPTLKYPGTILNCKKCHNTVAQAGNWSAKPTVAACNSCHTTVKFDGTAYTGIKGAEGRVHTEADNRGCAGCHPADIIAADHAPKADDDASLRTMESVISNVAVDDNGGVTVTFRVTDAGAPVTDPALFSGLDFTLAKLVPARGDAPSYWQSYLSKLRTKNAATPPVIQGRTEAYPEDGGILTQVGTTNEYTYKFALLNASTPGDIRTIDHVHNGTANTITGAYSAASLPTMLYRVPYEPTLTHRVAMGFNKELGATDIANKTNAFFDFVPAGVPAPTRNIVSRDACNKCHGDRKLHRGFALEYCVGCHTQYSFDPFSGIGSPALATTDTAQFGSSSVALERVVHKIHMGKDLANGYVINGSHDYSHAQYPGGVPSNSKTPKASNCRVCHDEGNAAMKDAANWKFANRVCGSCHDSLTATIHIAANTYDPTPEGTPGRYSGDEIEACTICHAPGGLAPVDEAHLGVAR